MYESYSTELFITTKFINSRYLPREEFREVALELIDLVFTSGICVRRALKKLYS